MAHMNPRLELASLDSILDAGVAHPAWVAAVARQVQRTAGLQAAVAFRRGRRAPMVSLQLATSCYANRVAIAVRRARSAAAGVARRALDVDVQALPCSGALESALNGDPSEAIEQLLPMLRDKRIERIVDELSMGSVTVAIERLEDLLIELAVPESEAA